MKNDERLTNGLEADRDRLRKEMRELEQKYFRLPDSRRTNDFPEWMGLDDFYFLRMFGRY